MWTNDSEYSLPNQEKLNQEKQLIYEEWEEKNKKKEVEIINNNKKYKFLHDILTETGDELVSATIVFRVARVF